MTESSLSAENARRIEIITKLLKDAFVSGAKFGAYTASGGWTMWQSDQFEAVSKAEEIYHPDAIRAALAGDTVKEESRG